MANHITTYTPEEAARAKVALDLLGQHTNDWDGSESLDEIIEHRWAIVIERDEDSWVRGIDNAKDIAGYELGCAFGTEGYDEWIEGVYDLATGEGIPYSRKVVIAVEADGETATLTRGARKVVIAVEADETATVTPDASKEED